MDKYDEAIKWFEKYGNVSENVKSIGMLLEGLCFLKKGDTQNAMEVLNKIDKNDLDAEGKEVLQKIINKN